MSSSSQHRKTPPPQIKQLSAEALLAQLQEQVDELEEINTIASTDPSMARRIWATNPNRKKQVKRLREGKDRSSRAGSRGLSGGESPGAMSFGDDTISSLGAESAEAELMALGRHRSTLAMQDDRKEFLRRHSSAYPQRVLLHLEESNNAITEDIRQSITAIEAKIEATKTITKQMKCDEGKFKNAIDRYQEQLYGGDISEPSGSKKSWDTRRDFLEELKERNTLERKALEAKIVTLVDQVEENERLIMDTQRPKIELLRKHLAKLNAKFADKKPLDRATVLEPNEKMLSVTELLALAKKKEFDLKEKKNKAEKKLVLDEKQLDKLDHIIKDTQAQLGELKRSALMADRGRSRSPLLNGSVASSRASVHQVEQEALDEIAAAAASASPRRSPSPLLLQKQARDLEDFVYGEEIDRYNLACIEQEARRVLKTTAECDMLDLQLRERGGTAKITFTERGHPKMKVTPVPRSTPQQQPSRFQGKLSAKLQHSNPLVKPTKRPIPKVAPGSGAKTTTQSSVDEKASAGKASRSATPSSQTPPKASPASQPLDTVHDQDPPAPDRSITPSKSRSPGMDEEIIPVAKGEPPGGSEWFELQGNAAKKAKK